MIHPYGLASQRLAALGRAAPAIILLGGVMSCAQTFENTCRPSAERAPYGLSGKWNASASMTGTSYCLEQRSPARVSGTMHHIAGQVDSLQGIVTPSGTVVLFNDTIHVVGRRVRDTVFIDWMGTPAGEQYTVPPLIREERHLR